MFLLPVAVIICRAGMLYSHLYPARHICNTIVGLPSNYTINSLSTIQQTYTTLLQ